MSKKYLYIFQQMENVFPNAESVYLNLWLDNFKFPYFRNSKFLTQSLNNFQNIHGHTRIVRICNNAPTNVRKSKHEMFLSCGFCHVSFLEMFHSSMFHSRISKTIWTIYIFSDWIVPQFSSKFHSHLNSFI